LKGLILLGFCFSAFGFSTHGQAIKFEFKFGQESLALGSTYIGDAGVVVDIETLRFYVSQLKLKKLGKTIWAEKDSYHLVDLTDSNSLQLSIIEGVEFDEISFLLGTDSLTNVSGAMGGDLDPTKGMYWAWNSGYINFKLEGSTPVRETRNNKFTFHLGGYAHPNATMQAVSLEVSESAIIIVDVKAFLDGINLKEVNSIMSPGKQAVELSEKAATIFKMKDVD
jgi:hypothetical protein